MATLPDSVAGLRAALREGTVSLPAALDAQHRRFRDGAARYGCATDVLAHDASRLSDPTLPLAGVGVAYKDIVAVAGRQPRCGTPWAQDTGVAEATAVQRLRMAGAHGLGMLAMAEFACGATGENPHLPRPINPVDPAAAVGGSSSGSAVAVAAGLCYGALGTDTAGSVRIPAATCGVLGLKPGPEAIDAAGVFPLSPSLDTVGVLAHSAEDARALFLVMAGQRETSASPTPAGAAVRVALCLERPNPVRPVNDDMRAALQQAAGRLGRVETVALPDLPEWVRCADLLLNVEAARVHADRLRDDTRPLAPGTRAVAVPGSILPGAWYRAALEARAGHRQRLLDTLFAAHDVLVTPVLPDGVPDWSEVHTASPGFQARALLALFSWTAFVNYLGLPAVSVPVGVDARGRPLSAQLIGAPASELALLALAARVAWPRTGTPTP
ncbi:amidase [Verticiella sediminum]|uniref:amidase n=1 Tax=Verticiella sediminum TaxID=1247510 RepID=UPI001FE2F7C6|nr:amidase [Verticiella sediminum]